MSHAATNWAIRQRGLKPAAKIVLWHLADCHNGHTGQCNPRQSTLADMCEMSRSTLNVHLAELERRGLIRRIVEVDPTSKRQRPTHYILAMDDPERSVSENRTRTQDVDPGAQDTAEPSPETGHGAVSGKSPEPSPDFGQSRVRNPDTIVNPGIEPGNEPCAQTRARAVNFDLEEFLTRFLEVYPRAGNAEKARGALSVALEAGCDPEAILAGARAYADEQKGNAQRYIAYPENWIERRGWERVKAKKPYDREAADRSMAERLKTGKPYLCRSISPSRARELVRRGLVSAEDCAKAEVPV